MNDEEVMIPDMRKEEVTIVDMRSDDYLNQTVVVFRHFKHVLVNNWLLTVASGGRKNTL